METNQVQCPWCGNEVLLYNDVCPECRMEVLPKHLEGHGEATSELDASAVEVAEEAELEQVEHDDIAAEIMESYECRKCGHDQCHVKEVAMTGTGLSKLFDIQYNHYLFVSCLQCGSVDIYDPNVLKARKVGLLGKGLDLFL